ncbi:MAG: hypothetical protein KIH65_004695 [Candidatus Uhrbacteria bacterium]|nr:hypothetical protein [Candidatus Uhrbacteria bacterium]
MRDYVDSTTADFVRRIAREIDQRSRSAIGTSVIDRYAGLLREDESFHTFIGRVFDLVKISFSERQSDLIFVRVQEVPESMCRVIMCLAHGNCEPMYIVLAPQWRIPYRDIHVVAEVFRQFAILASEPDALAVSQIGKNVGNAFVH